MRESVIEKKVKDYAKSKGFLVYKFNSFANRAVPDDIFIYCGYIIFIEFKAPGKRPTALQAKLHKEFEDNGAHVYVIDDVDVGKKLIDSIVTTKREVSYIPRGREKSVTARLSEVSTRPFE